MTGPITFQATDPDASTPTGPSRAARCCSRYDMEVGAGTFHPATFLRALGPEPWNAAYVQPSRRPKDGRYGENPNRLQHYYQYQVVLKPAPDDIHELYLGSLRRSASIRWSTTCASSRTTGNPDARRLGPGLGSLAERHGSHAVHLLPAGRRPRLQAGAPARSPTASSAWRCTCRASTTSSTWSGPTARTAASPTATSTTRTRSSRSTYNFEHADVAELLHRFDACEARGAAADRSSALPLPAYEQVCKAAHTLQPARRARRDLVTERQRYILRVRTLSRRWRRRTTRSARSSASRA